MIRNIRLTLAYDGTDFAGWQVQKAQRTVQGVIEEALARMHGHPVRIRGAGRTDSGVHATGQVANFHTELDSIPAARWHLALNSYLPPDVRVLESLEADPDFSAKKSARLRVYAYHLLAAEVGPPHLRRYCWKILRRPETAALNRLAAVFLGEHDFHDLRRGRGRQPQQGAPGAVLLLLSRGAVSACTASRPPPSSGRWCAASWARCWSTRPKAARRPS